MSAYDVLKDFGLPIVTFLAGMVVEKMRERRSGASELARQRNADSPWFALVENGVRTARGRRELSLRLRNDGAPVTCDDFQCTTAGYEIRNWNPSSLPTGEMLVAVVAGPTETDGVACDFDLRIHDRSGSPRKFRINLDVRTSPPKFEVSELPLA